MLDPSSIVEKTEKQKMLSGELYLASDPELVAEREACRRVLAAYNAASPSRVDDADALLHTLLGQVGHNVFIQPPFYCDYVCTLKRIMNESC